MDKLNLWLDYYYWNKKCGEIVLRGSIHRYISEVKKFSLELKAYYAFLIALFYNVVDSYYVLDKLGYPFKISDVELLWKTEKNTLHFTSDRFWVKAKDLFIPIMNDYVNRTHFDFIGYLKSISDKSPRENFKAVMEVDLFTHYGWFVKNILVGILKNFYPIEEYYVDFNRAESPKRGVWCIAGREMTIKETNEYFQELLKIMENAYINKGIKPAVDEAESSLCGFHKFIDGQRYVGYYIDRNLNEIYNFKQLHKSFDVSILIEARSYLDKRLRGEYYNNYKIRKIKTLSPLPQYYE